MKKTYSKHGFSLVSVMVAAGLMGGLALMLTKLQTMGNKTSARTEFALDATLTSNQINAILSDPAICKTIFATTATPTSINNQFFIKSSPSAPSNGYGNSHLKIISYTLTASGNDGTLTIAYQKKRILKGSSSVNHKDKKIKLYVEGTPGAITRCRSLSTSNTDIWSRGTGANISYSGGNIGVGTSTPATALDVAGAVKIGTSTSACTATIEGATRYSTANKVLEYCDGTAWNSLKPVPPVSYLDLKTGKVWKGDPLCKTVTRTTLHGMAWGDACAYVTDQHLSGGYYPWTYTKNWNVTVCIRINNSNVFQSKISRSKIKVIDVCQAYTCCGGPSSSRTIAAVPGTWKNGRSSLGNDHNSAWTGNYAVVSVAMDTSNIFKFTVAGAVNYITVP